MNILSKWSVTGAQCALLFSLGCGADPSDQADDQSADAVGTPVADETASVQIDDSKTVRKLDGQELDFTEKEHPAACVYHSLWINFENHSYWTCPTNYRTPTTWFTLGDGLYGGWDMEVPASGGMHPGPSGTYITNFDMCPDQQWAMAIGYRGESSQGSGDDSGMNGVFLLCGDRYGNYGPQISSDYQVWGTDYYWWYVGGGVPIVGGLLQIEGSQGGGDDTAANRIFSVWSNGASANLGVTNYGSWSNNGVYKTCPAGQAVCGVQTRVEYQQNVWNSIGYEQDFDDTALNGVRFACCPF